MNKATLMELRTRLIRQQMGPEVPLIRSELKSSGKTLIALKTDLMCCCCFLWTFTFSPARLSLL